MYKILIKQFFRSKTVLLALVILLTLGGLSINTGKQFLSYKQLAVQKTIEQQKKHLETQTKLHKDDLGLLLYYLKFSFVNPIAPIAGLSIGQSDVNSHIQNIKILNLEGQKYDTDFINPMRLQVGNLDMSFLIIFLFPLLIIALSFNTLSEEMEKGTWNIVKIQGTSSFKFLLMKLCIRILFVLVILNILFLLAKFVLNIPLSINFLYIIVISHLYVLFWFAICFFVMLQRKSSNTNAIALLTTWLLLVVFIPVAANNFITSSYPIDDAFALTIKQRDSYHKKWDTDKKETMEKFYSHYPQFRKYPLKEEGFSWLWYYAMQQMGDDESKEERQAMYTKIENREKLSTKIAQFFPPMQVQLSMNKIANTSLTHQVKFLNATTKFHENIRLAFYPKIFENKNADAVIWENYNNPQFFTANSKFNLIKNTFPMLLITFILISLGISRNIKFFK